MQWCLVLIFLCSQLSEDAQTDLASPDLSITLSLKRGNHSCLPHTGALITHHVQERRGKHNHHDLLLFQTFCRQTLTLHPATATTENTTH